MYSHMTESRPNQEERNRKDSSEDREHQSLVITVCHNINENLT